jgi:hypothetical protein
MKFKDILWLIEFVAGPSGEWPRFLPVLVHAEFVVHKDYKWDIFLSLYFNDSAPLTIPQVLHACIYPSTIDGIES